MIVVISTFPSVESQKDGMVQRIAHIDRLMAASTRVYLELSFRRYIRKEILVEGNVTVYRLNVFAHFFMISRMLKSARLVYIHSAYNAHRTFMFRTNAHVVFDAHGVVPEELELQGKPWAARIFGVAERLAIRRCDTLICVTQSMLTHFHSKLGKRPGRSEVILTILPRTGGADEAAAALTASRHANAVIYAGGMQTWQNIDKMLDAAAVQSGLYYTFLTGDKQRFTARLQSRGIPHYACLSVEPEAVKDFYIAHEYGFVLRDEVLVNLVACPTKLMEYLYWGVVPIVITPKIGDFNAESLKTISLERFVQGDLPDRQSLKGMREHNQQQFLRIFANAQVHQVQLQRLLRGLPINTR